MQIHFKINQNDLMMVFTSEIEIYQKLTAHLTTLLPACNKFSIEICGDISEDPAKKMVLDALLKVVKKFNVTEVILPKDITTTAVKSQSLVRTLDLINHFIHIKFLNSKTSYHTALLWEWRTFCDIPYSKSGIPDGSPSDPEELKAFNRGKKAATNLSTYIESCFNLNDWGMSFSSGKRRVIH